MAKVFYSAYMCCCGCGGWDPQDAHGNVRCWNCGRYAKSTCRFTQEVREDGC